METRKGQYGNEYERYRGAIWVSKDDPNKTHQGKNIALLQGDKFLVLGYEVDHGNPIEFRHKVENVIKAVGWTDEYVSEITSK